MSIVITDPSLQSQFLRVAEAELCDSAGKSLGHFVSPEYLRKLLLNSVDAQVSKEELDRRFHEPGGSTLSEIWARLESS